MTTHTKYIQRCIELAKLGAGHVAPNPMVGAVLVYDDHIIGEGTHQQYGQAHAEVNCLASVKEEDKVLITGSTLYVSLEPCAHYGKTPPCTDLIIQHKIPKIVIGCRDPFEKVNGKGIEKLQAAGLEVELVDKPLRHECEKLNKRFFTFHKEQRPYVILKWAQTKDGFIASTSPNPSDPSTSSGGVLESANLSKSLRVSESKVPPCGGFRGAFPSEGREVSRLLISNEYTNRLVHQWRSQEAAILVGTNTALLDDPELTNRLWPGASPVRLIVDKELKLPASLKIFNRQVRTIIFNMIKQEEDGNLLYYRLKNDASLVCQVLNALYELKLQSVLVEGGAKLLQSFIDEGSWDEARVIVNGQLALSDSRSAGNGVAAPTMENDLLCGSEQLFSDTIETYFPVENNR